MQIQLTWKPPAILNGKLLRYDVMFSQSKLLLATQRHRNPLETKADITGLIPNSQYSIVVRAVNAAGIGPTRFVV